MIRRALLRLGDDAVGLRLCGIGARGAVERRQGDIGSVHATGSVRLVDGELYGSMMELEFVRKLRDEAHFEKIDDLIAQMREDERQARHCLAADLTEQKRT